MHFDIVEAIRQKQQKQPKNLRVENGKVVDITICDGTVVVTPDVSPEPELPDVTK